MTNGTYFNCNWSVSLQTKLQWPEGSNLDWLCKNVENGAYIYTYIYIIKW